MTFRHALFLVGCSAALQAQSDSVQLPEVTVYSPRVANQSPVATFAMPVSALRFEPEVDAQTRNFGEAQSDISIRGGIFESTGFTLGAVSLLDPQTGHYLAEIPVAPAMLTAPRIVTGADLALSSMNATTGAVSYGWRPIKTAGALSIGGGQYQLTEAEAYGGFARQLGQSGLQLGADFAWAHSDSNGSLPYGDHDFNRVNGRLQLLGRGAQTDLFAGYQAKFFGWPNLYTPFNSNETENLKTLLVLLNHRVDLGAGDFVEAGAYYRRNRDDYAFNRFAPVGPVHPFNHTTWVRGAAVSARKTVDEIVLNARAEFLSDFLESTSLLSGRYHSRDISKLSLVPERSWTLADGAKLVARAGATYDHTNRNGSAVSPVVELARETPAPQVMQRMYVSFSDTTQVASYTALNSNPSAGLFRGNPNLGRETSHNFEVGASGAAAGWTFQTAAFYRQDNDLVDWTFRRGVTARSANAVDIATTGVEIVTRRSWNVCDLVLGYTWLTKNADYRGAVVDASFYALNYARQRLTAAIVARLGREVEVRFDNEFRVQAANLLRTTGGDHPVISSLGLVYRPGALRAVSFSAQIDNLWDSRFQEVPAVPAARRQFSASVHYTW
jgi:hypothetical protein